MTLRRKLLVMFGGLAVIALVVAGVTLWVTVRWDATSAQLEAHYQRSLLLQRVRAATFQAVKEVADALFLNDADAELEFRRAIAPAEGDLKRWAELADTDEERGEIEKVKAAFRQLVAEANRAFILIQQGDRKAAAAVMEEQLERTEYVAFQRATQLAVDRDQARRQVIQAAVTNVQDTAYIILTIAGFAILSLVLLLGAYLASDLFRPLGAVQRGLEDFARGDLEVRLSENREDEIGRINRAFNLMAENLRRRERVAGLASMTPSAHASGSFGRNGEGRTPGDWRDTPSRVALHTLVAQLSGRLAALRNQEGATNNAELSEALQNANDLLNAVARLTEFSFPLDLNLSRTDLRALIYDAVLRFQDEIAQRGVSCEINLDPSVDHVLVDRLKLREVLSETIRNALAALPKQAGRLGVRTLGIDGKEYVAIEIADNGRGMDTTTLNGLLDENPFGVDRQTGLALTSAVIEQHGGKLDIISRPGMGTVVRIELPTRG